MLAIGEERGSGLAARAASGALDGLGATAAMSGVMYVARRAGWLGRPPPATITERALRANLENAIERHPPALFDSQRMIRRLQLDPRSLPSRPWMHLTLEMEGVALTFQAMSLTPP